jgi:hypothetical protein
MTVVTVTGDMAQVLAARLTASGYRVRFLPGRDPAVFNVIRLPGGPDVEVSAEDDGSVSCHTPGAPVRRQPGSSPGFRCPAIPRFRPRPPTR